MPESDQEAPYTEVDLLYVIAYLSVSLKYAVVYCAAITLCVVAYACTLRYGPGFIVAHTTFTNTLCVLLLGLLVPAATGALCAYIVYRTLRTAHTSQRYALEAIRRIETRNVTDAAEE